MVRWGVGRTVEAYVRLAPTNQLQNDDQRLSREAVSLCQNRPGRPIHARPTKRLKEHRQ